MLHNSNERTVSFANGTFNATDRVEVMYHVWRVMKNERLSLRSESNFYNHSPYQPMHAAAHFPAAADPMFAVIQNLLSILTRNKIRRAP